MPDIALCKSGIALIVDEPCLARAKQVLTAKDVRVQKLIAEFALRVVPLAQLNEVGQLIVNRFQLRWRCGKQFSPMWPGIKWS